MRLRTRTAALAIAISSLFSLSVGAATAAPVQTGISPATTKTLEAVIAKYSKVPTFTAPGPPINVKSLVGKGKSVYIIPETDNDFNNVNVAEMKTVATQAGLKVTVYANQGTTSQWVQGMQSAISEKVSLIILANAPDPRALQPQLKAAKAAHIPVVVTHFYDDSTAAPPNCTGCAAGVTALETAPFNTAASLLADWTILQSKGDADVLIPIVNGVIPSPGMEATMKAQFTKYCPACKTKFVNIPLADFATSALANDIQASVSGDPNINWIDDQLDSMVPATTTAVNTAGRAGKIKIVGYNGSTFAIKDIQDKTSFVMDVGESAPWIGYATMDQAFRILLGKPTVHESAPVRIFDSANAASAGNPPSLSSGYGSAYKAGFDKLWGLG
jgi:ribose transport system substrate-binding protein